MLDLFIRPASNPQSFVFFNIGREPVLSPEDWREFPLVEKIPISHNTNLYRFGLPDPEDNLGLPPGQHVSVSAEIDGKAITRSYTPTTGNDDLGHFDLVVKACCHPTFRSTQPPNRNLFVADV